MAKIYVEDIQLLTSCYRNKQALNSVNLYNVPWASNSMANAFWNCTNLNSVTGINENVTNMYTAFRDCTNLVNAPVIPNSVTDMSYTFYNCIGLVNAPAIPNSVTSMYNTFMNCTNLVNAPAIPNSVTNMAGTFQACRMLADAPVIPNSVTSMQWTFAYCLSLVNSPIIPNSVTSMLGTFCYCHNLSGNIYIYSENITNANQCFLAASTLQKNVYIPFTYENSVNTLTYNAFIAAGYTDDGSVNGVYLKDLNAGQSVDIGNDYTYTYDQGILTLDKYTGTTDTDITTPHL